MKYISIMGVVTVSLPRGVSMTVPGFIWGVLPVKGVFLSESTCDGRVELKSRGDATAAAMAITTTEKLTSAMIHGRS